MNTIIRQREQNSGRTNLISILTLIAILSGLLLFFTNEQQREQVIISYCGDFGLYDKQLTLLKNGTFRFSYYGCSQTNGYVKGKWTSQDNLLTFSPAAKEILDTKYKKVNSRLIPVNLNNEPFIVCEDY